MDAAILTQISRIIAAALDNNALEDLGASLNAAIPGNISGAERAQALEQAVVYSLVCEQPGYSPDGQPGYLPSDTNLKEAVLREIDAMITADFDKSEHLQTWQEIKKSVDSTPEAEFAPGVAVNCPDDYLLMLTRISCADILRQRQALPAWAQQPEAGNE